MIVPHQQACVIFNKLAITNIEDASGVFFGTNQAIGWSSSAKQNQGFGSVRDASLHNVAGVVYDQDAVDACMEDYRYISLTESGNGRQQAGIDFGEIGAESLSNSSAIALGSNRQLGWRSARKTNFGTGKYFGANRVVRTAAMISDNDVVDAPFHSEALIDERTGGGGPDVRIAQKTGDRTARGRG